MSALLGWFLSNPTVLGILAAVVAALGWGFQQRLAGAKAERNKQAADRLQSMKHKKEIDDEVADLGPADLDTRFKRWLRDNG